MVTSSDELSHARIILSEGFRVKEWFLKKEIIIPSTLQNNRSANYENKRLVQSHIQCMCIDY